MEKELDRLDDLALKHLANVQACRVRLEPRRIYPRTDRPGRLVSPTPSGKHLHPAHPVTKSGRNRQCRPQSRKKWRPSKEK